MALRTYVGFVAHFPVDISRDDEPPGKELANFVATLLKGAGIRAHGPDEPEGWAWNIFAGIDGITVDTLVGLVDDLDATPPRQWLITNDSDLSIWNRLFGSRDARLEHENALRRYCEILHAAFTADPRFSHIRWYDKKTFDKPDDEPGASP
ncbi:hypothetical protein [Planctomicrobium piriforme]|uniref:Uncharacterized protein n=1 Tax=Planctomicrobium piriforme TaxID=1576369 RepID=A0A1I3E6Q9_9PLAN|nr:hypothetical protein [Planctomicrobium piriforme]SFH94672.1 hypothetical protein SAMN05421753_104103 [Planctomicrobium piriforme]